MSKRFTDTEKWKDEWFLELEPLMKMLWIYMLDTCDYAGVWKVNFRLASYAIGTALDRQSALKALGDRVHVVALDKWHIPKFITYQQKGKLNPSNKAHKGILNLLEYHGIDTSPYLAPYKVVPSSLGIGIGITNNSSLIVSKKEELVITNPPAKLSSDKLVQLFNDTLAGKAGKISHCRGLSGKDLHEFVTTSGFEDFQKLETWKEIFQVVANSEFLRGESNSSFVATLNWLVNHDNALKVLNGQYNGLGLKQKGGKSSQTPLTPGNPTGNPYLAKLKAMEEGA